MKRSFGVRAWWFSFRLLMWWYCCSLPSECQEEEEEEEELEVEEMVEMKEMEEMEKKGGSSFFVSTPLPSSPPSLYKVESLGFPL